MYIKNKIKWVYVEMYSFTEGLAVSLGMLILNICISYLYLSKEMIFGISLTFGSDNT